MKRWLAVVVLALGFVGVQARDALPLAADEAVEQRLRVLAEELRCLVCQNESLAGSRAELAQDLRREIRTMIRQGRSDAEIVDYLVARYGDFVLYRPRVQPTTWLLWGGPFVLLALGLGVLVLNVRRRAAAPGALSAAERKQAAKLLETTR
jgi:cytochrome c-type biogenesis protein CcmH